MASREALALFLSSLDRRNYYEILRIPSDASPPDIKSAFHAFSLLYHPDVYANSPDVVAVASEIFKRGVEAYRCLSRRETRARYDRALARGRIRIEPGMPSTRPPPPLVRTLEMVARTPRAKKLAEKADRLIAIAMLDEARVELVSACQCEPDNEELAERLQFLYEAMALETP
ncbi:MAG: DnaJ domain-containing protein [Polyangiaceae bacterium]